MFHLDTGLERYVVDAVKLDRVTQITILILIVVVAMCWGC